MFEHRSDCMLCSLLDSLLDSLLNSTRNTFFDSFTENLLRYFTHFRIPSFFTFQIMDSQ